MCHSEPCGMFIRDLTTSECHDVLRKVAIARLACARDNQPYIVPVHVYFDGDCLYSFATLGQKIAWMRENPRVCVQVDDVGDRFHWATVVVFGQYEELLHMPSDEEARRRAQRLFQSVPEWWQPASADTTAHEARMPVIYRIRIDTVTGRLAERAEGETNERPWWLDLLFEPPDALRHDT
jgi:nitroimidazol reductase NimA-like FMN-containing flavoprotein (pyridoxamine 5'-phosphate oxidase superfamily)